jgi:hypothetical protein
VTDAASTSDAALPDPDGGPAADGGPDAAGDAGLKLCSFGTPCLGQPYCYTNGPIACDTVAPGLCSWTHIQCVNGFFTGPAMNGHGPKDLGDTPLGPPCSTVTCSAAKLGDLGKYCSDNTDPGIGSGCLNGGTDPFRKSVDTYYKCVSGGAFDYLQLAGATYTACVP